MTSRDDELIASFLADGPNHGRPMALDSTLTSVRAARQRPAWLARVAAGTFGSQQPTLLRMAPVFAAVALMTVIAGALIAGNQQPPPEQTPIGVPSTSAIPTEPAPSASVSERLGLVAYGVVESLEPGQGNCLSPSSIGCSVLRIWTSNADGSGAHAIHPDEVRGEALVSWTADGTRLFYVDADGFVMAEPDGTVVQRWPDAICPGGCQSSGGGWSLSPDGTRVAYVTLAADGPESSVISILDLVTNEVIDLEETRTTNPPLSTCHERTDCPGMNDLPTWSPDGTRIAYTRQTMSPERDDAWVSSAIYVVNVDGTDLRRVTPVGWSASGARWSADSTLLLITRTQAFVAPDGQSATPELYDVYTVRPDGTDLAPLTDDGHSFSPAWTTDGRVTFMRLVLTAEIEHYENWIVNADGTSATRLPESLEALSAVGCTTCMYPFPTPPDGPNQALWQP